MLASSVGGSSADLSVSAEVECSVERAIRDVDESLLLLMGTSGRKVLALRKTPYVRYRDLCALASPYRECARGVAFGGLGGGERWGSSVGRAYGREDKTLREGGASVGVVLRLKELSMSVSSEVSGSVDVSVVEAGEVEKAGGVEEAVEVAGGVEVGQVVEGPRWYARVGEVALRVGKVALGVTVKAGKAAGQAAAQAYSAVDPDLRRHVAQLPLMGVSYLSAGRPRIEALPEDGHRVVLCVHGLGGHPGNFMGLRAYLKLMGRTRTYAASFPGGVGLGEMAVHLRGVIDEIVEVNRLDDEAQIDIVAHSMGGIVARLALVGGGRRVGRLITLGSPHGGTWTARYAQTVHTVELRPDSETLRALGAQVPWAGPPELPELVTFWSKADVLIVPGESACVEGARSIEMPEYTHYSYLINPRAWERILRALGDA